MDRIKCEIFFLFELKFHKWDWIIALELQESSVRDNILYFFLNYGWGDSSFEHKAPLPHLCKCGTRGMVLIGLKKHMMEESKTFC
jgi:hypothetical protein